MDRFFVYRPVFGWVIAAFITLFGLLALVRLPIEQYPSVAPPSLNLRYNYTGADAETVEKSVTTIIEQEMTGLSGFLYMGSTSRSNGSGNIRLTFESGTDLDVTRSRVQDQLKGVEARLPAEVRQLGIRVGDNDAGFLMLMALSSRDGSMTPLDMGNYAVNNIENELRRVPGVGDILVFGSAYAMRIWLDPTKLAGYALTPGEVLAAVREQNSQTAGGGLGEQPVAPGTELNAKIVTQNRLSSVEQFSQIIVKSNEDGSLVRLADVARVELGKNSYNFKGRLNGKEVVGIGVMLSSGANAVATAEAVRTRMDQLATNFPPGMTWETAFDTTPFINASIEGVIHTLVEAMVLVFLVMFLFLQDWRATLIPAIVVPIALLGACLGLQMFGFSLNTLSLFAMVVAIGILVDDAIVVVENVERIMSEEGLPPRLATIKAMGQIRGAIVGITLVLIAVFVPMAFFPGSTGGIYRQFSVTLAVSIFFSALLALTLTPALCATLLKAHAHKGEPRSGPLGWPARFFAWFNASFGRATDRYTGNVTRMLGRPFRWFAVFLVMAVLAVLLFTRLPGGFLPDEDQGYIMVNVDAPAGATQARTDAVVQQAEDFIRKQGEVRNVISLLGYNFYGQNQSAALMFVDLHPWEEREGADHKAQALVARIQKFASGLPGAIVFALNPPAIQALGFANGFSMKIEDRGGSDREGLAAARNAIIAAAAEDPLLTQVRAEGQGEAPQLFVDIDRVKARALGLSISAVNQALSINFGSAYANDFSRDGSTLRVYLQAEAGARMKPDDILAMQVRGDKGQMVPFSAFATATWMSGPIQLERFNGYPSLTISGAAAPGKSSGAALAEMEKLAAEHLGGNFAYEWTGTAYEEKQAGGQIGALLGLSVIVVFLLLSALYNSWGIPVAVLMVVPFGVLGAVVLTMGRGLSADVYFNIGLITIIGLAAKNAILIVEFALEDEDRGSDPEAATIEGSRQRLRPILMTSLAFILGMVPLVIAAGAGAASRQAVGTGVMGGMIAATAFGVFFTPVFYLLARRYLSKRVDLAGEDEAWLEGRRRASSGHGDEGSVPHA
ncbi:multidrug efflux RND transporter permease subunit [Novosphingobium profundi]|uniref:multidrug efflux RND transporter permease subunit n=1 Tax=Novosphingobium profundi TaxID=1774954 RepID=UPI001BDAEA37|nr:multidrug efflux RND transporter permease subunit [Novosphingobium profundi]MBT0671432.1 multidrug efflux RND transporter permease subunit [Novosphingobium profundi]